MQLIEINNIHKDEEYLEKYTWNEKPENCIGRMVVLEDDFIYLSTVDSFGFTIGSVVASTENVATVKLYGKMLVAQDGTCIAGKKCKCTLDGKVRHTDNYGWMVLGLSGDYAKILYLY